MQISHPLDDRDDSSPIGGVAAGVFAVCLLGLGFIAGSYAMYREAFPAETLRHAFQGGAALYDKATRYNDPFGTDLWRPARTAKTGVVRHDVAAAQAGVTLYSSGHDQRAFLMDMDGKVLHEWSMPFSRLWDETAAVRAPQSDDHIYIEKAHVFPNGDLLALYVAVGDTPWGYGLAKLDRDSNVIWKYLGHAHHDFDIDAAGNIHALAQEISNQPLPGFDYLRPPRIDDFLVELSPDGKEIGKTWLTGALALSPAGRRLNMATWYARAGSGDYLHTNSVDIIDRPIPGVAASRPGQALLSFREINAVGLVDQQSQRVVWLSAGSWMRQHDADLLPNGHILLFDNEGDPSGDGASRVMEIDPANQAVVWSYHGKPDAPLESIVRSSQDRLANGNTLIVESDAGRVIEVTPGGKIVWEFINPVRGAGDKIPIIFWVERLDPTGFEPAFRERWAS
jgi:hypothetical protein